MPIRSNVQTNPNDDRMKSIGLWLDTIDEDDQSVRDLA